MATKKAALTVSRVTRTAPADGFESYFDGRKYFIQDLSRELVLVVASKRSNGIVINGDWQASHAAAVALADLLGL